MSSHCYLFTLEGTEFLKASYTEWNSHASERDLRLFYVIGKRILEIRLSSYDYFPEYLLKQETLAFCLAIAKKSSPPGLLTYRTMRSQMHVVVSCWVCGNLLHSTRKQLHVNNILFSSRSILMGKTVLFPAQYSAPSRVPGVYSRCSVKICWMNEQWWHVPECRKVIL